MDDGEGDELGAADAGDDGERGVGRGGAADADGGQRTEEAHEQGREQEGGELAQHVVHQGQGAELDVAHLGDEHAGERVVAEAGAHGEPVGNATTRHEQGHEQGARPGGEDGDEGHEHEALVEVAQVVAHLVALPYAEAYAHEQHAQAIVGGFGGKVGIGSEMAEHASADEAGEDEEAVLHAGPQHAQACTAGCARRPRVALAGLDPTPQEQGAHTATERGEQGHEQGLGAQLA